ncbi:MAG: hypothetical protein GY861_16465 [bacterium]|nr:hypothetical protein [bacterium]
MIKRGILFICDVCEKTSFEENGHRDELPHEWIQLDKHEWVRQCIVCGDTCLQDGIGSLNDIQARLKEEEREEDE